MAHPGHLGSGHDLTVFRVGRLAQAASSRPLKHPPLAAADADRIVAVDRPCGRIVEALGVGAPFLAERADRVHLSLSPISLISNSRIRRGRNSTRQPR